MRNSLGKIQTLLNISKEVSFKPIRHYYPVTNSLIVPRVKLRINGNYTLSHRDLASFCWHRDHTRKLWQDISMQISYTDFDLFTFEEPDENILPCKVILHAIFFVHKCRELKVFPLIIRIYTTSLFTSWNKKRSMHLYFKGGIICKCSILISCIYRRQNSKFASNN